MPHLPTPPSARLQWIGVLLFLFIPLVLFLFVRHPEPVGLSLAAGVVLMVGHRFLARPYMARALERKCLWCNRALPAGSETLELATGAGPLTARCCPGHRPPAARFFAFVDAWRLPLRAGIFLPLLLLLGGLAAAALGRAVPLPGITALFQLVVGLTVNAAALGPFVARGVRARERVEVPFPVHNFFLLGVRNLLWIFRLVGIWWIVRGLVYFLRS
ncbi:MAG: hypothetical protein QOJ16_5066 [Acidobacteriota bacterium]|jgi:hypothetical protein|nr:hypothetical protein [Acidobacteriota bacterium]